MRLPASQYSVLDAKKIERLDDDTFICYVGGISFLGFVVEPVLTVSVIVHDRGPVVKLLDTKVLFTVCMYSTTQLYVLFFSIFRKLHTDQHSWRPSHWASIHCIAGGGHMRLLVCSYKAPRQLWQPMIALMPP